MSTKWLTAAEQAAWRAFITTMPDLTAAMEADLAAAGVAAPLQPAG